MTEHSMTTTHDRATGLFCIRCSCGAYGEGATVTLAGAALADDHLRRAQPAPANDFDNIRHWAMDRNLIKGASPQAQMLKLTEEVGELAHAVARGKMPEAKDAIGDIVVVLTILAAQIDMSIEDCIAAAYDEIKDRKGRMVDGIFVKEE